MRILVACEESQAVTKELRLFGHEAYSCDTLECTGGHPEWHIRSDVRNVILDRWDMIIAFPPCTHLACSGAAHFEKKIKDGRQQEAIDFFMLIAEAPCKKIAIENPVGIMSTVWRKPDQIIQPWQFGDSFQKTTCLWLKGLPKLMPTKIVDKGEFVEFESGKRMPKWYAEKWGNGGERSKTFPGIARAMSEQWGKPVGLEAFS